MVDFVLEKKIYILFYTFLKIKTRYLKYFNPKSVPKLILNTKAHPMYDMIDNGTFSIINGAH